MSKQFFSLLISLAAAGNFCFAQIEKRPELEASNRAIVFAGEKPAPATGPLKQSAANPNYFEDAAGKPVVLIGSHT